MGHDGGVSGNAVGVVQQLRRYPIKSMLGEVVPRATLTARGMLGDRVGAVVDDETGRVVSVKYPRRWARIFELRAVTGDDEGVCVCFPDGTQLSMDDRALAGELSAFFGRTVRVAASPPPNAVFDELWLRDLKGGADPYLGLPSRTVEGEELVEGGQFMSAQGTFFNYGAVHLVTTGTTRRLTELAPATRFDPQRFRPNIVVDTPETGFVETDWVGRTLTIGEVQLAVSMTVPRCVMTTLAQEDVPADRAVLRTITKHNAIDPGIGGAYPCVGIYADVLREGEIRTGDSVAVS
jgi:MOSC domain-containing protein